MPKISGSKGRQDENSGYARLFGSQKLGSLISRVQATVIRAGNELENIIEQETPVHLKSNLHTILNRQQTLFDVFPIGVVFHPKMPGAGEQKGGQADVLIVDHDKRYIHIIELKDGDTFDTKKASGELDSMSRFADWISQQTGYGADFYFCSFNQEDKEAIVQGAKGRFGVENVMTGRELCRILEIDYDMLREKREQEQPENLYYFVSELLQISEVRALIEKLLSRGSKNA
jgi:hypothetical protein